MIFQSADILIPNKNVNMEKWAVIACDQHTAEPEYWEQVYAEAGDKPSALNLILPEIYLEDDDVDKRVENIHENMEKYINDGTFDEYKDSMIYAERIQSDGICRKGIIGKIDLEEYDYSKGSTSMVRATEATVVERIPPRIKVRNGAFLELPHIMILIDDPDKTVIEPLADASLQKVYDTKLMMGGGSIKGYLIDKETQKQINAALSRLADPEEFSKKYGVSDKAVMAFAMGDGNHSLATAKAYYEQLKKENPDADMSDHPARYALAEIVNLHSDALRFEAIHRLVYDVDCDKLIAEMKSYLGITENECSQYFTFVCGGKEKKCFIGKPASGLSVGSVQIFLDEYVKKNGGKMDYIHGIDTVKSLAERHNGIAFIFPDMHKSELFPAIINGGVLPRKTFSIGTAEDKRFYIEARKIAR